MSKLTRRQRRKQKAGPIVPIKEKKKEPEYKSRAKEEKGFFKWYDENVQKLMIIPTLIVILSIIIIIVQTAQTGSFVNRGISLTGGQTITILDQSISAPEIEERLRQEFPGTEINVRLLSEYGEQRGIIIESTLDAELDQILSILMEYNPDVDQNYSVESIGSSLSQGFFKEVMIALLIAFIFMSIVVFFLFKTGWPSIAIIAAALSDMIVSVAVINVLGIKLSTAGIAALLMLIGYSVDTDILLTTRLLKAKRGNYLDRTKRAMKTGLTMTTTALGVVIVGLIASESDVLRQIFTILLIGLLADILFTWIQNVTILWVYLKRKGLRK